MENFTGVHRSYYNSFGHLPKIIKSEVFMLNGKEEGIRNEYNNLGLIYRTSEFVNGKIHGKQITYISEIPAMERIFENDYKIEEKHFNPHTGKVIEHYKYKYDKLKNRTYYECISIEL
jgi:antitoxin component YwqK of YwqJK toxin-antitoxin module